MSKRKMSVDQDSGLMGLGVQESERRYIEIEGEYDFVKESKLLGISEKFLREVSIRNDWEGKRRKYQRGEVDSELGKSVIPVDDGVIRQIAGVVGSDVGLVGDDRIDMDMLNDLEVVVLDKIRSGQASVKVSDYLEIMKYKRQIRENRKRQESVIIVGAEPVDVTEVLDVIEVVHED